MKIVRYAVDNRAEYGICHGDTVTSLADSPYYGLSTAGRQYRLSDLGLLPPCQPTKIAALGLNYHSHARELGMPPPDEPLLFLKPSTTVIGPGEDIVYPDSSRQVDYEGELGVVIKKPARRVDASGAADYILGYTCFNDVTARDLQRKDKQWTRAKGFDTFAAVGPCIETELDPASAPLETYLNGVLRQQTTTGDLIFSVPGLVSFISHIMTLLPGDIIATGTPAGIGPMQPGDTVEIRIEPIGTLRNHVVKS